MSDLSPFLNDAVVVLLLQGGGGRAAYQCGVYEALSDLGLDVDWVVGISSGACNAAIIAGNPPEQRAARLRAFWDRISLPWWDLGDQFFPGSDPMSEMMRNTWHMGSAALGMIGQPGFYSRHPLPWFMYPPGSPEATSRYSQDPLRESLESTVDFDYINSNDGPTVSFRCANAETGQLVFFYNRTGLRRVGDLRPGYTIVPDHVLASGALPDGAAGVTLEHRRKGKGVYWDGGVISNSPLLAVGELLKQVDRPVLILDVELWQRRGAVPSFLPGVASRKDELSFASRSDSTLAAFRMHRQRATRQSLEPGTTGVTQLLPKLMQPWRVLRLTYDGQEAYAPVDPMDFGPRAIRSRWDQGRAETTRVLTELRSIWEPGGKGPPPPAGGVEEQLRRVDASMSTSILLPYLPDDDPKASLHQEEEVYVFRRGEFVVDS